MRFSLVFDVPIAEVFIVETFSSQAARPHVSLLCPGVVPGSLGLRLVS